MTQVYLPLLKKILNKYLPDDQHSLRDRAKHIGMNPGHLSRILSGKRKLCLDSALALIVALEIDDLDSELILKISAQADAAATVERISARLAKMQVPDRKVLERVSADLRANYTLRIT